MRVVFLPVNQVWVVLFGDSIIDIDDERFFADLDDLKCCLRHKGLKVVGRKIVTS